MSKKILLIESDASFARDMAAAIETRGLEARVTGDGREGLELAKANRPDAIVLCVELPKMSGYSVCNKLKKDDELKHIPLVIISAEATAATFDQHRKLKTHAEDYLLKPFDAAALLQKIAGLVELPPEPAANDTLDEEIVTLDDVEELEALAESAPDAEDLRTDGVGMALGEDEDLKLFDEAFGTLEVPDAAPADATADAGELLAASLSEADGEPSQAVQDAADSADAALEALGLDDFAESEVDAGALLAPPPAPERTTDAFHLAPAPQPTVIVPPPPPALAELHGAHRASEADGAPGELQALQDRVSELRIELARRDEELQRSTADHAEAEQRAQAIALDGAARERAADARARAAEERAGAAEEAAAAARADAEARAAAAAADAEARIGAALAAAEERAGAAIADADARVSAAAAEAEQAVAGGAAEVEERVRAARAEAEEAVKAACAEADAAVRAAQADSEEAVRVACQQADDRVGAAEARAAEAEASAAAAAERSTAAEERTRAAEARAEAADARADASDASAAEAAARASAAEQRAQVAEASEAAARARAETAEADAAARAAELAEATERAGALARELDLERLRASGYDGELAALRPELETVRSDLVASRGDLDAARNEAERHAAELTKRIVELEAQTARHEERVVKAYQKIKGDEKIREKTRKALAIALQLLEDRPAAAPATAAVEVQPRRE